MKKITMFLILIVTISLIFANCSFAVTEKDNKVLKIYNAESERYGLAFDIEGYNNGKLVQTTWGNNSKESGMSGYMTFMKVNDNDAQKYVKYTGDMIQSINGVNLKVDGEFVNNGKYVKIIYTLKNNNSTDSKISLGTCADVQIGDNDKATVERMNDSKGVKLYSTSENLQFSFYGKSVKEVTDIDNLWIGKWVDDWYKKDGFLEENIVFAANSTDKIEDLDSSFAYSWVDETIKAGEEKTYSVLIGVGAITHAPEIELSTKNNEEISNDTVKIKGIIKDEDISDTETLYYAIDGKDEKEYSKKCTVNQGTANFELDLTNEKLDFGNHSIKIWAIDSQGNPSDIVTLNITLIKPVEKADNTGENTSSRSSSGTSSNLSKSSSSDSLSKSDTTTTSKIIPKTGKDIAIFGIIVLVIALGIAGAVKYYKYRDIK